MSETLELNRFYYTESSNLRTVRSRSVAPKKTPLNKTKRKKKQDVPWNNHIILGHEGDFSDPDLDGSGIFGPDPISADLERGHDYFTNFNA